LELLTKDGHASMAAIAGLSVHHNPVDKAGHDLTRACPRLGGSLRLLITLASTTRDSSRRVDWECLDSRESEVQSSVDATMLTTLRPRFVLNSTAPAANANSVSSPPRPTRSPG